MFHWFGLKLAGPGDWSGSDHRDRCCAVPVLRDGFEPGRRTRPGTSPGRRYPLGAPTGIRQVRRAARPRSAGTRLGGNDLGSGRGRRSRRPGACGRRSARNPAARSYGPRSPTPGPKRTSRSGQR